MVKNSDLNVKQWLTIRISSSNMMPNLNLHSKDSEHGWDLIIKHG